jgi:hypothetical protein
MKGKCLQRLPPNQGEIYYKFVEIRIKLIDCYKHMAFEITFRDITSQAMYI